MAKYKSPYAKQMQTITSGILDRPAFAYDMNADAIYDIYKQQYMSQGDYAARDTMADMAGMTGGMVSSAAVNAGNSAYQGQMSALNAKVPELYQSALQKYNAETSDLYSRFNLLYQLDNQGYQRFRDGVTDAYNDKMFNFQKKKAGL